MKNTIIKRVMGITLAASMLLSDCFVFRSEAFPGDSVSVNEAAGESGPVTENSDPATENSNTVSENTTISENNIPDEDNTPGENKTALGVNISVSGNEVLAAESESAEGEGHTLPVKDALISYYADMEGQFASAYILPQSEQGEVIKANNQNGQEWAYALCSALGSSLKKKYPEKEISISPETLVSWLYSEKKDSAIDKYGSISGDLVQASDRQTGNVHTAMWAAAAGYAIENTKATDQKYRLDNINMYTGREVNKIKNALMTEGEVAASLYKVTDCFIKNTSPTSGYALSYYCPESKIPRSGLEHAVTIIGWDDEYSYSSFRYAEMGLNAARNGAWLVKDAYGYGGETCYWVSYYDAALYGGFVNCYSFDVTEDSDTAHTYQYDGGSGYFMYGAYDCAKAVNIFPKAGLHEVLSAVSFGTYTQNAKYKIQVYLEAEPAGNGKNQPSLEKPLFKKPITTQEYARWGYYTIDLEAYAAQYTCSPEISSQDEKGYFAVEITIEEGKNFLSGDKKTFWIDGANNYNVEPLCRPDPSAFGQSYIYQDNRWVDFSQDMPEWGDFPNGKGSNIRIKAHVQDRIAVESVNGNQVWRGETLALQASLGGELLEEGENLQWSSDNKQVATVTEDGTVVAKAAGYAQITVTSKNYGSDTIQIMVKDAVCTDKLTLCSNSVRKEKRTGQITCTFYPSEYQPDRIEYIISPEDSEYLVLDNTGSVTVRQSAGTQENLPVRVVIFDGERQIIKEVKVSCYQVPKAFRIVGEDQEIQEQYTLKVSEQLQLGILITDPMDAESDIQWKSSNAAVVSVTPGGKLCALKEGSAVITASSQDNPDIKDQVKVTVRKGVSRLLLDAGYIDLLPGESRKLGITVFPENSEHPEIEWFITDLDGQRLALQNETVSFDPDTGTLTAGRESMRNTGVRLYAQCDGVTAGCFIRVKIPVRSVWLSFSDSALVTAMKAETSVTEALKDPIRLYSRLDPEIASGADTVLFYSSKNPDIARVTKEGEIIPLKEGKVELTAETENGINAAVSLEISSIYTNQSLLLQSDADKIYAGGWMEREPEAAQITVTADGEIVSAEDFNWESSNEDVAVVDDDGYVTALSKGSVTITAADKLNPANKARISLKVGIGVKEIQTERNYYEIAPGCTVALDCKVLPVDADGKTLTLRAQDEEIVQCSKTEVRGLKEGTTTVYIESENGFEKAVTVKVMKQKAQFLQARMNQELLTTIGTKDSRAQILAEATDENGGKSGVSQIFKYYSDNPDIVQVDANGHVNGGMEGETFIRVLTTDGSNLSASVHVTVKAANSGIKSVILNHSKVELRSERDLELFATILPENAQGIHEVTWSSMDDKVATVNSYGMVRTHGYGCTQIVARTLDGTKSAVCEIRVLPIESQIKLRKINDQMLENKMINPDSGYQIHVYADDGKDYGAYCEFISSNPEVCTVSEDGFLEPAKQAANGTSTITAKVKDDLLGRKVSFKVKLTDEKQVADIRIQAGLAAGEQEIGAQSPLYLPFEIGGETELAAFALDRGGSLIQESRFKWSVSDKKVISVKELSGGKAELVIKGSGSCVLTCTAQNQSQTSVSVPVYVYDTSPVLTEKSLSVNLLKKESISLPLKTCTGTRISGLSLTYIKKGKEYLDEGFTVTSLNNISGTYVLDYDAQTLAKGNYVIYAQAVITFNESEEGKILKEIFHNQDSCTQVLEIPVKVTEQKPKVKIKQPTLNVFEKDAETELVITSGEEINKIELLDGKSSGVTKKFRLEKRDGSFLLHALTGEKGSFRAVLQVYLKDYVDPVLVNCTIKAVLQKPKLSVLPKKLFVYKNGTEEASVTFSVWDPVQNQFISGQSGYEVTKGGTLQEDQVTVNGLNKYGKKTMELSVSNEDLWNGEVVLKIPITVEDEKKIALETSQSKLSLNKKLKNDCAEVSVYMKQQNLQVNSIKNVDIYDAKGRLTDEIEWSQNTETGKATVEFQALESCAKGKYKAEITAAASNGKSYKKSITLTVEDTLPSVKVKLKGSIDIYNRADTFMTGTVSLSRTSSDVVDITSEREDFRAAYDQETGQFVLTLKPYYMISAKKQTVMLNILLSNGDSLKKAVNITLRQSKVKWKKQDIPVLYKSKGSRSIIIPFETETPLDADIGITVLSLPKGMKIGRTVRNRLSIILEDENLKPGKYKIKTAVRFYDSSGYLPMDGLAAKKDIIIQIK